MKTYICECGKEFDKIRGMTGHQSRCKVHQKLLHDKKEARRLSNGMFKCENPDCEKEHDGSYGSGRFCSLQCRRHYVALQSAQTAIKNGTKHCPTNFRREKAPYGRWKCPNCGFIAKTRKEFFKHKKEANHHGISGGIKGSKLSEEHKQKISKSLIGKSSGKCKDPLKEQERRKNISKTAKLRGTVGGRRQGSGRGKQGWYKGYWCDSSWELAWVIYNLDHNISFTRYNGFFEYEFEGKKHKYYPDFLMANGTIVEIKGAEKLAQWKAKFQQFPKDKILQVIGKNEIRKYLEYVIQKYGKDFVSLYEKK